jgi:pimeloyl-ACP methyl ester carboxylesterase
MRRPLIRLGAMGAIAWSLAAILPATAQSVSASPPSPPPGRLVDVGGWRLHLNCTGDPRPGQPTVILEAGSGDFSVEWSLVQPQASRSARVCSYDRAGDGWSELGPHPRTFRQVVYELHTLLDKAGERPPYVLVGHSYGGWLVRTYQATYPAEVTGMIFVEAGADNPARLMPDGTFVRSAQLATGNPVPTVNTTRPLRIDDIPPGALQQMRAGLSDASQHANEPPRDKLPRDAQQMRTWALGQLGHVAAAVNPFEHEELAVLRAGRTEREFPLGDLPLVVITRGISAEDGPDGKAFAAEHRQDHEAMARLSRNGRLIVAEKSGHHVQIDEPDVVVKAIQQVVSSASTRK